MTQGMTSLWNYLNKVYIQVSPTCPPFEISTNNAGGGAAKFYKGLFRKKLSITLLLLRIQYIAMQSWMRTC